MKQIGIITAFCLAVLASCGTPKLTPEQEAEQEKVSQQVSSALDAKQFTIDVRYMNPMRAGGKPVNDSYSLTIDGDKIVSALPYVGRGYNIPFGGGTGLNFEAEISAYNDSGFTKGCRTITVTVDNGEDHLVYTIKVFNNGTADIHVDSRIRDSISFRGDLVLE